MNLEKALKHFNPKSQMITDSPRATSSDSLTGSDMCAGLGMAEAEAPFGMGAFLGKHGISLDDKTKTIQRLTAYAMQQAPKHLGKAAGQRMAHCMVILSKMAYAEYCHSAATTTTCQHCDGKGLIYRYQEVVKHPGCGEKTEPWIVTELVGEYCTHCEGKGVISHRCRCKGTGRVRDLEKSALIGAPVDKECERCDGRGYKRTPGTIAYKAISALLPDLQERTWNRNWRPFYESLVVKCDMEENMAAYAFSRVTK